MSKAGIKAAIFGITANLLLFFVKLYVSISTNCLAIYCDGINNLGDTISCIALLIGFIIMARLNNKMADRLQSLLSFVVSLFITIMGCYFVYNGLERIMYPVVSSYYTKYAILMVATVFVKIAMAAVYHCFNKKHSSPIFKALVLDSLLDVAITIMAIMGFSLITRLNLAVDGIFGIIIGIVVAVASGKEVIEHSKSLINE